MANTKSSKKDLRRTIKKTIRNRAVKSSLKTHVKKVRQAAGANDAQAASVAVVEVASAMDKAVQRGIIHKNQAARRKSRIAKAANALLKAGGTAVAVKASKPAASKNDKKPKTAAKPAPKAAAKPVVEKKAATDKKPAAAAKKAAATKFANETKPTVKKATPKKAKSE